MIFEWDEQKEKVNLQTHKISFAEAETVFYDPYALSMPDPDHSIEEERFIDIGRSAKHRILLVVYTERRENIRIISARKATASERKIYEKERKS
jgi:uncharacterized DUF497 family protein